jgi:hypothetical protein
MDNRYRPLRDRRKGINVKVESRKIKGALTQKVEIGASDPLAQNHIEIIKRNHARYLGKFTDGYYVTSITTR